MIFINQMRLQSLGSFLVTLAIFGVNPIAADSTSTRSGTSNFSYYRAGPAIGGAMMASLVPPAIIGGLADWCVTRSLDQ